MELYDGFYFLEVQKKGLVDSSSIIAIRDSKGLICVETGCGGEENIKKTLGLFNREGLDISDIHTVIISHTHADHMGAVGYFKKVVPRMTVIDHELDAPVLQDSTLLYDIYDVDLIPTYFPGQTFDILELYRGLCPISEVTPDRMVTEGDRIECGEYVLNVIHTPGHHSGHISLYEEHHGMLFVGDMLGIDVPFYTPSSGGVTGYLESIQKYRSFDVTRIIPSHGALIENPEVALRAAEGKVINRETRLLEAIQKQPRTFHDLLPELFHDTFFHVFPGTAMLQSHLIKLETEGKIFKESERYFVGSA